MRRERLDVVRIEQLERRPGAAACRQVRGLFRNQLELEGRFVVDQHASAPVEDQAAAGRNRILAHAVALRELEVVVVANDLQVGELAEQARGSACR